MMLGCFVLECGCKSLVLYSFVLGHTNMSQNTFLCLSLTTGSYMAHGMRMTISSMFFMLIATPLVLHGGCRPSCQLRPSSPHSNTSNPWISCWYSMDSHAVVWFPWQEVSRGNMRQMMCFGIFVVSTLLHSLAAVAAARPPPPAASNDKGVGSTTTIALAVGVLPPIAVNRKLDVFALQLPCHIIE